LIWNWKLLYFFLTADNALSFDSRISIISFRYINWQYNLLYPFVSAVFLVGIYPIFTTSAMWIWLRYRKWQRELRNKIENTLLLNAEESQNLRLEIAKEEERIAIAMRRKEAELQDANKMLEEQQNKIEMYERDLKGFRIEKADWEEVKKSMEAEIAGLSKEGVLRKGTRDRSVNLESIELLVANVASSKGLLDPLRTRITDVENGNAFSSHMIFEPALKFLLENELLREVGVVKATGERHYEFTAKGKAFVDEFLRVDHQGKGPTLSSS
jgi:hypothetical protein